MTEVLNRLADARDEHELEALVTAVGDVGPALAELGQLADELAPFGALDARALVNHAAASIARAARLEREAERFAALRDLLAATATLLGGRLEEAAPAVDDASARLSRLGDAGLALEGHAIAAAALAAAGAGREALAQATSALDAFAALAACDEAETLPQVVAADEGRQILVPRALRLLVVEVGQAIAAGPAAAEATPFFARASRVLRSTGNTELAWLTEAQLGRALVRSGEPERAAEILAPAVDAIRGYAAPGGARRLTEPDDAALALGRALDRIGRDEDAERRYRELGSPAARVALAELLVEEERIEEALAELAADTGPHGRALAAKVYALVNRPEERRRAAEEARRGLEDCPAEEAVRARALLVEQELAAGGAPDPALAAELERLAQDAALLGLPDLPLTRLAGDLELAAGRPAAALERYDAALEEALVVPQRGAWMRERGMEVLDAVLLVQAVELRSERQERGVGLELLVLIARTRELLGENAQAAYERAIDAAARRKRQATLVRVLGWFGLWLRGQGEEQEAKRHLEQAADALEALRAGLRDVDLQVGALAAAESIYAALVDQAVARGDRAAAVRAIERAKSRALLDFVAARGADQRALPPLGDETRLLRRRLLRAMRRAFTEARSPELEAELAELKDRLHAAFRARRRVAAPPPMPAASPDEVAALAVPGMLVLHLFASHDRVYLAPARNRAIEPVVTVDAAPRTIADLLEVFAYERSVRAEPASLLELHRLLIEPVADLLDGVERLLMLPYGVLHGVPFGALRAANGSYLCERFVVATASSAALARAAAGGGADESSGGAGFAVETLDYVALPRLAGAADELDLAAAARPLVRRVGREALRRRLLELEGPLDVLHFACHGEFDPTHPLLSRLYLADGPIYADELLSLRCRPRLVVLSACQTGVRERRPGDELFGLIRPFVALGAGAVVATLWNVTDESVVELMWRFYAGPPADPAAALCAAQVELIRSERWSHPHHWAPYFVVGGLGGG